MSEDFNRRKAEFESHLNECGMNGQTMYEGLQKAAEIAGDFTKELFSRTMQQAAYDQLTNLPTGVLSHEDYDPRRTVESGLVSAIGAFIKWDPDAAVEICRRILEDNNLHHLTITEK